MKALLSLVLTLMTAQAYSSQVCSSVDQQKGTTTYFIFNDTYSVLGAVCQRSQNQTNVSDNKQICVGDQFLPAGFSTSSNSSSRSSTSSEKSTSYQSLNTNVVLTYTESNGQHTISLDKSYSAKALEGSNQVVIPSGNYSLACKKN